MSEMKTAGVDSIAGASSNVQYGIDMFNPVRDRLDEGTVIERWIPNDIAGINRMWRLIYTRDDVGGPAVDLFKDLPWSAWSLAGIDDPKIKNLYEDALDALDIEQFMRDSTGDFLIYGRLAASLLFNEQKGYWDGAIVQNPDYIAIAPIPLWGFDAKLDLLVNPMLRQFLASKDPRDTFARRTIPPQFIQQLLTTGRVPLSPLNTAFLPRKTVADDYVGTSYFTRLLTYWALGKPLINAAAIGPRRRAGGVLHLTVGTENWEPSDEELDYYSNVFIQADDDPIGAVVATRQGVQMDRGVDSNQYIWKIGDDFGYLTDAKMHALGINAAMLEGDANWNTMDASMSAFLERVKVLRAYMTQKVITDTIFTTLARLHGFVRRTPAELAHNIRIGSSPHTRFGARTSLSKALEIPKSELILPTVVWEKRLKPVADEGWLNILRMGEEFGIPVLLSDFAEAMGKDLQKTERGLKDDLAQRERFQEWKAKKASMGGGDAGGGAFASAQDEASYRKASVAKTGKDFKAMAVWRNGRFLTLDQKTFLKAAKKVVKEGRSFNEATKGMSDTQRMASEYLLMRGGALPLRPFEHRPARQIAQWVGETALHAKDGNAGELAKELHFVNVLANYAQWKEARNERRKPQSFDIDLQSPGPALKRPMSVRGLKGQEKVVADTRNERIVPSPMLLSGRVPTRTLKDSNRE